MPDKRSGTHYPFSQDPFKTFFQNLLLLCQVLSSWAKKPIRHVLRSAIFGSLFFAPIALQFHPLPWRNVWTIEETLQIALDQFFQALRITARDILFLIVDDTRAKKTGKKIPGRGWHKDHLEETMGLRKYKTSVSKNSTMEGGKGHHI